MLPVLFVFLIGLIIGSFLNVVVARTKSGRSLVFSRSACETCGVTVAPHDLMPLLSFFLLRGRCRACTAPISWQYPAVEFATGLLLALAYLRYTQGFALPEEFVNSQLFWWLIRDGVFFSFLMVLFVYDWRFLLLPDRFTIPGIAIALLINAWLGLPILSLLLAVGLLAGFFIIQHFISHGSWVGTGDIRMGALVGAMLGLPEGLLALFLAYLIGAGVGVFLLLTRRANWRTPVPFGAFLALGAVAALFLGPVLVNWYLGLF